MIFCFGGKKIFFCRCPPPKKIDHMIEPKSTFSLDRPGFLRLISLVIIANERVCVCVKEPTSQKNTKGLTWYVHPGSGILGQTVSNKGNRVRFKGEVKCCKFPKVQHLGFRHVRPDPRLLYNVYHTMYSG